jgi:lysophospholipase L1-like esterase
MYRQQKNIDGSVQKQVQRLSDNAFIPFDPANTDYAQFKKAVAEDAELQDADGVKMTAKAVKAFIATLP